MLDRELVDILSKTLDMMDANHMLRVVDNIISVHVEDVMVVPSALVVATLVLVTHSQ